MNREKENAFLSSN